MDTGGAETFLMKIYRNLDRSKYQMDFCVNIARKGFFDDEIESLGGKVYHIPSKSENLKAFKQQLYHLIKENNYQHVLRITSNAAGFLDLKIAKKAGAQVCIARSSNSSDGNSVKLKVVHCLGRLLYKKYVDVMLAPSDLAAIYTFGNTAYKRGKVHILHNALNLNEYRYNSLGRKKIRNELKISDTALVIGHIGRFNRQKNHELLIDIFKEIHKRNYSAVLLLVGTGELKDKTREKVQNYGLSSNVIFENNRADIPDILSAMDVLVFPSYYEGMPNIIIEAQANGLPCVISSAITQEANISGKLSYRDINESISCWGDEIMKVTSQGRYDAKRDLLVKGYDIRKICEEFVAYIFENNTVKYGELYDI